MGNVAIRTKGIGKQYRIGVQRERYYTLRDALIGAAKAPFRRFRRLSGKSGGDGEMFWALRDVSLEVKQGDVLGIIGRNGAGKSTLLKILCRVSRPTKGFADVYGRVGSLLEVGTGFHPELTGRENIYLSGAVLGMRKAEITGKFDEIVDFSGIEQFLETPVKHYSSGMYVRLAFAVAAHLEPEILLVDEVLAVGDADFQKKCLGKMETAAYRGRTILFVSHNMNAVEKLCRSAILLEAGAVKENSHDVRSVIRSYLFDSGEETAFSEWVNPGNLLDNEWFKPLRFFVADKSGQKQRMPLRNDADMWVQIEGELKRSDARFTVGYGIYVEDGQLLYWSFSTDGPEDSWPTAWTGRCTFKSPLPKRVLNEGSYRLELLAFIHTSHWLSEPMNSAPCVTLTIKGGLSDSPHWMEKRQGMLGPVMKWYVEQ
ncbi:MAG: ABC transporter ATP-binding protein [Desulfomonilaceae bacterium]